MHPFAALAVPAGSVGIHWFEQNAYALKDSRGMILQIDPYYPVDRPPDRFIHPEPPLVEAALPTDYVLMTHDHGDHTNPETVARILSAWPQVRCIGPQEAIERVVAEAGVPLAQTATLAAGETLSLGDVAVHASYSKPPAGDPAAGIAPPDVTHLGYVIEMAGIVLYNTGDCIHTLADLDDLIAPVAAMQPDIGFITMHPTEGEFPSFQGGVRLAQKLGLETAVPSHYSCFVKRDYDPQEWAALLPPGGPRSLIIPWNSHVIYRPAA